MEKDLSQTTTKKIKLIIQMRSLVEIVSYTGETWRIVLFAREFEISDLHIIVIVGYDMRSSMQTATSLQL